MDAPKNSQPDQATPLHKRLNGVVATFLVGLWALMALLLLDDWLPPHPTYRWFFALLICAGFTTLIRRLILPFFSHRMPFPLLSRSVESRPIKEVRQDLLGFTSLATALAQFLRHGKTRAPLTIAITAPWGKGKSSLMHLLHTQLKERGVQTVWFNVWHHQHEPVLLAPLLNAIIQQGIPPLFSVRGLVFRMSLFHCRLSHTLAPLRYLADVLAALLPVLFALLLIAFIAYFQSTGVHPGIRWLIDTGAATLHWLWDDTPFPQLITGEWREFLNKLTNLSVQKFLNLAAFFCALTASWWFFAYAIRPFPASPAALLATLTTRRFSLRAAEEQTGFRERFAKHFNDVCASSDQLTIFIDDLDRCEPAKIAELLEATNYLSESGPCRIVIAAAEEIVELQLGEHFRQLAERAVEYHHPHHPSPQSPFHRRHYARDYLRKLFQIRVPVPHFTPDRQERLLTNDFASREEIQALTTKETLKAFAQMGWQGLRQLFKHIWHPTATIAFISVLWLLWQLYLVANGSPAYDVPESNQPHTALSSAQPVKPSVNADGPSISQATLHYWLFLSVLFTQLIYAWRYRYRVDNSPEFEEALAKWGKLLLANPSLRSPRESNRVVTLARYASLRLNPSRFDQPNPIWKWLLTKVLRRARKEPAAAVDDTTIVRLTALYQTMPSLIAHQHPDGESTVDRARRITDYLTSPDAVGTSYCADPADPDIESKAQQKLQAVLDKIREIAPKPSEHTSRPEDVKLFLECIGEIVMPEPPPEDPVSPEIDWPHFS